MLGRPALTSDSYMDENFPSILASASFVQLRIGRNGWLAGTKSSGLTVENKLSLYPSVPRIAVPDLFNIAIVGRMSRFFNSLLGRSPASHLQLIEPRSNPSNITVGQKRLLLCRCAAALLRRIVSSHDFIGVAATR